MRGVNLLHYVNVLREENDGNSKVVQKVHERRGTQK